MCLVLVCTLHQGDLALRRWVAKNLAASAFAISGGVLNNIVMSRLYRAGSVAYVSTSGGMSNELNNTISRSSNGVFEGVAIGGKRELGSRFFFLVIICFASTMHLAPRFCCFWRGSVVRIEAVESGKITKPAMVCWHMCILFGC